MPQRTAEKKDFSQFAHGANPLPPLPHELKRIKNLDLKLPEIPFISGCDYKTVDTPSSGNHRIFRVCT